MGNFCSQHGHVLDAPDLDSKELVVRSKARDFSACRGLRTSQPLAPAPLAPAPGGLLLGPGGASASGAKAGGPSTPTGGGRQSLLFLECCADLPCSAPSLSSVLSGPLNACAAPSSGGPVSGATGRPYVRAWVQAGSDIKGSVVEWPARPSSGAPSWFSARPLRVDLLSAAASAAAEAAAASARRDGDGAAALAVKLCFEVRDGAILLATASVPASELRGHELIVRDLQLERGGLPIGEDDAVKSATISFQVLDSDVVCQERRVVYLVRHGESLWNAAQSSGNVPEMARQYDHPLSSKGQTQAEGLRGRIAAARRRGEPAAVEFCKAGTVFASPLCRALQTAAIALGGATAEAEGSGEFVLMPMAREKQNLGGFDSMSSRLGADIVQHAFQDLCDSRLDSDDGGGGSSSSGWKANFSGEVLEAMGHLRYDVLETEEQWWCEGNSDTSTMLRSRLKEFMTQLLYMPQTTAVVVGHSHFFRSVLKTFHSEALAKAKPRLVADLGSMKLSNCGVVRIELDPRVGVDGGPIVEVDLVFGTKMQSDGALFGACCAAPGIVEDDDMLDGQSLSVQATPTKESPTTTAPSLESTPEELRPPGQPSASRETTPQPLRL